MLLRRGLLENDTLTNLAVNISVNGSAVQRAADALSNLVTRGKLSVRPYCRAYPQLLTCYNLEIFCLYPKPINSNTNVLGRRHPCPLETALAAVSAQGMMSACLCMLHINHLCLEVQRMASSDDVRCAGIRDRSCLDA